MSGQDFLVSACNAAAVAWLDRWPQWPSPFLVIYGEKGCGKTHLASVFQAVTHARLLDSVTEDPYDTLGEATVAVLEDADEIAVSNPRALFHLYNYAKEQGRHVLLTAHRPPVEWSVSLADLRSRLGAASVVGIEAPDDGLLRALLVKLFADRQVMIDEDVVSFIVKRIPRSFDAVQKSVAVIDRVALAQKRRITIPLVRDVLAFPSS